MPLPGKCRLIYPTMTSNGTRLMQMDPFPKNQSFHGAPRGGFACLKAGVWVLVRFTYIFEFFFRCCSDQIVCPSILQARLMLGCLPTTPQPVVCTVASVRHPARLRNWLSSPPTTASIIVQHRHIYLNGGWSRNLHKNNLASKSDPAPICAVHSRSFTVAKHTIQPSRTPPKY